MKTSYCFSSLQNEVLVLSVIDGLGAVTLFGLVFYVFYPTVVDISHMKLDLDIDFILTFVFGLGALLIQLFLAFALFWASLNNRRRPCRVWLCVSTLLVILKIITVIAHLATGNHDVISYGLLVDCVYKVYQGIVVASFITSELNEDRTGLVVLQKKWNVRQLYL